MKERYRKATLLIDNVAEKFTDKGKNFNSEHLKDVVDNISMNKVKKELNGQINKIYKLAKELIKIENNDELMDEFMNNIRIEDLSNIGKNEMRDEDTLDQEGMDSENQ